MLTADHSVASLRMKASGESERSEVFIVALPEQRSQSSACATGALENQILIYFFFLADFLKEQNAALSVNGSKEGKRSTSRDCIAGTPARITLIPRNSVASRTARSGSAQGG